VRQRTPDSLPANPASKVIAGTHIRPRQNAFRRQFGALQTPV
jgi:hypothetical protein